MKSFVGIVIGGVLAVAIAACATRAKQQDTTLPPPPDRVRAEIDELDRAITDQMARLDEPRPAPQPGACTEGCAQQLSAGAATAVAQAQKCAESKSATCTDVCRLKGTICENAGRICKLAGDLGGNDAYANDKCSKGTASCDAATQRCCNCI